MNPNLNILCAISEIYRKVLNNKRTKHLFYWEKFPFSSVNLLNLTSKKYSAQHTWNSSYFCSCTYHILKLQLKYHLK